MTVSEVQPSGDDRRAMTATMSRQQELAASLWPYAGCWVALIGGQVAGIGASPVEAELAARHSRPRERIDEIRFVPKPDEPGAAGDSP